MIHAHMQPSMLHFLLGFFTMITVTRWWKVYGLMEWPDSVSSSLSVHLRQSTSVAPFFPDFFMFFNPNFHAT